MTQVKEKENNVSESEKYGVTECEVCHLLQIGGVLRRERSVVFDVGRYFPSHDQKDVTGDCSDQKENHPGREHVSLVFEEDISAKEGNDSEVDHA